MIDEESVTEKKGKLREGNSVCVVQIQSKRSKYTGEREEQEDEKRSKEKKESRIKCDKDRGS
jgi:hypothetical protein